MVLSRSAVALVGAGVLGLALVGVGASASFTDTVSVSQSITAARLDVNISSSTDAAAKVSSDGRTLTLAPAGPVPSTFTTEAQTVVVTNNSKIPAVATSVTFSATASAGASTLLKAGTNVTLGYQGQTVYNGPITQLIDNGPFALSTFSPTARTLAANGGAMEFTMAFSGTDLPTGAQGGVVTPKITITGEG